MTMIEMIVAAVVSLVFRASFGSIQEMGRARLSNFGHGPDERVVDGSLLQSARDGASMFRVICILLFLAFAGLAVWAWFSPFSGWWRLTWLVFILLFIVRQRLDFMANHRISSRSI